MAKFYFSKYEDSCFTLDYWKQYIKDNEIESMVLKEAKRMTVIEYFYCREYFEVGEKGNCGKQCDGYKPNNGVSGRCKHYGFCYEESDVEVSLRYTDGTVSVFSFNNELNLKQLLPNEDKQSTKNKWS